MILDILYLLLLFACLVVLIVLFIKKIREDRKYKKKIAELDKRREEMLTLKERGSQLKQYRIVKARTAGNGEKYFVEFYHAADNTWNTIDYPAHDTYKNALWHKEILEQARREKRANTIVAKGVVE